MSRRARTTTRTGPGTATRLLTASALVGFGTLGAVSATAEEAPTAAEDDVIERTLVVTPADRITPVDVEQDELTEVLFAALDARASLDAEAPPEPEPEPEQEPAATDPEPAADPEPAPSSSGISLETWERVAQCESGGNWSIDTGNSFYGGLQFTIDSWRWVGGTGYPHEASKATQIEMAERLHARQGWQAWPSCSRQLGLR